MQEEPPTLDEMIEQVEQLYQELLDQKFAPPLTMTERYRRLKFLWYPHYHRIL